MLAYEIQDSPYTIKRTKNTPDNIQPNPDRGVVLEQQAEELYKRGNTLETIPLTKKAIALYRAEGNLSREATVLRNLALIYQQLGQWERAEEAISSITSVLLKIPAANERKKIFAQTLDVRGQLELSRGQAQIALASWKQAAAIYREINDLDRFSQSKIYQAQALQTQGLYSRAIDTLTEVKEELKTEPNSLLKAQALRSIGKVLRGIGHYEESESVLKESLAIAENLESQQIVADIYLSLGSTL